MKKILALGSFLTLVLPVNAGSFYVTLSGGISSLKDTDLLQIGGRAYVTFPTDDAFSGEFGIGYDFENTIRTDITYSTSKHDIDNLFNSAGEAELSNIFLNIYADFESSNSKFTPYVGAGVGSSKVDLELDGTTFSDSSTTYQVKVGTNYAVSKKANLFLEGAYSTISKLTYTEAEGTLKPNIISYKAGLRYTF